MTGSKKSASRRTRAIPVAPPLDAARGVALVTGGGRRIGAAIVRALHADGLRVIVHYRESSAEAEALVAELETLRTGSAFALRADLGRVRDFERFAKQAHARWGRLDALVNNASSYAATPIGVMEERTFDALIASNLKAPLFLAQALRPYLEKTAGSIVGVLDTHAHAAPRPGYSAYTAAKAAHWSLIESLAVELAPRIRCNGVAPGHVLAEVHAVPTAAEKADLADKKKQLPKIPAGRFASPGEIAQVVRFLVSPAASYLTGVVIPVDGGRRLS